MGSKRERQRFFATVAGAAITIFTGGLGAGFSAALAGVTFTKVALATAASYALNALNPQQKQAGNASGGYGVGVNAVLPNAPRQVIYGRPRVGGAVFYQNVLPDNVTLYQCIAFADHEITSYDEIYLNEEKIDPNTIDTGIIPNYNTAFLLISPDGTSRNIFGATSYQERLGTLDQSFASMPSNTQWTEEHKAAGVAYLTVRHYYDANRKDFPNGVPAISALISGKKVYDPRTGETAFTDISGVEIGRNPALILRDYLIYSGIATTAEIDEDAFSTAANICDENVTLSGGSTEKRYRCDGAYLTQENPQDIIKSIIATMGGMIWYSNGKWSCKAAAYTSSVLTLDEDDLRSGLEISTRNSRRDGFNKVIGLFRGEETSWQPTNYPEIKSDEFVRIDGGEESVLELDLPFVSSSSQAQRIAKIALYRNREQLKVSGSFGLRALQLSVGDIIKINNTRLGFVNKEFEVIEWTFGLNGDMALEVVMTLQEISSAVFDWDAEESTFESNNTQLASPFYVPDVSITLTNEVRVINQHLTSVIAVDVSSDNAAQIEDVEVEYLKYNNQTVKYNDLDQSLANGAISVVDGAWGVARSGGGLLTEVTSLTRRFYFGWTSGGPTEAFFDQIRGTSANGVVSFLANEQGDYDEFTFFTSQSGKSGSAKFDVLFIQKQQTAAGGGWYLVQTAAPVVLIGDLTGLSTSEGVNVFFAWEFLRTGTDKGYTLIGRGDLGRYEIIDAFIEDVDNPQYTRYSIRARASNSLGVRGAYTEVGRVTQHDTTGPTAVSSIEQRIAGSALHLDWEPSASGDLSHYKIHRNYETSGAGFNDFHTVPVVNRVARPASSATMIAQSGTFFIEPYDKSGNAGTVSSIVINANDLDQRTNSETYTISGTTADFSSTVGTRDNTTIWSGYYGKEIHITDYTVAPSTGTYFSYGYDDLGSDQNVRLFVSELFVERYAPPSTTYVTAFSDHSGPYDINFDALQGNIDSWPKDYDWDDFDRQTVNFKDVSVEVYARAYPAGGGSPLTDYVKLPCELYGGRFLFKYVLKSTADNVTPVLQKAVISMEYN